MEEKSRALALLGQGMSVINVAADIKVTRPVIYALKAAAANLPVGRTPERKRGSGAPKKTSPRTDAVLRREVMSNPSITASE